MTKGLNRGAVEERGRGRSKFNQFQGSVRRGEDKGEQGARGQEAVRNVETFGAGV